jgi:hypothetical protein
MNSFSSGNGGERKEDRAKQLECRALSGRQEVSHETPQPRTGVLLRNEQATQGVSIRDQCRQGTQILSTVKKNSPKSSAATIPALANQGGRFKRCCLSGGSFDGVNRHDYFR